MKFKLLFALMFVVSSVMANQVVFNPATYDPADLPEGMEIVEIDGESYCRIVLNGWSSTIPIEDVILDAGRTHFRMDAKLSLSASDTLTLAQVNTFLKLANNRTDVEIGAAGNASSADFMEYMISVATADTVTTVQVAGQETVGWNAIAGDTLWIGKVELITYDPAAVLDPGSIDPDELAEGQTIEMIDGKEYVQVILNGWNSTIAVKDRIVTDAASHFVVDAKMALGASDTLALTQVNTFLKLANFRTGEVEIGASGAASSADFSTYTVSIATNDTVTAVQVAGQETVGWTAIVGDTLWVGKLLLADLAAPSKVGNLAAAVDGTSVTLTWEEATDNIAVDHYVILQDDAVIEEDESGLTITVADLDYATYTFGVVSVDAAGNESGAEEIEVSVSNVAIEVAAKAELKVYPNPANSVLNLSGISDLKSVQIISMTGAVVAEYNETQVDVSGLSNGLYLIKVYTSNKNYIQTFVKE